MRFKNILKRLGKNLLVAVYGAVIGMIVFLIYLFKIWTPANADKIGLGIIALAPVLFILFSILGMIVGGIVGIVIYQVKGFLRKR